MAPRSLLAQFVLEGLPDPVLILDPRGAVLEANRCARETLSRDTLELFRVERRTPPLVAFFEMLVDTGRASLEIEHASGGVRGPRQLSLDGFAAERRYVLRVRDVTEQRGVEQELAQLKRGGTFGVLAATIIHDFNNLLTPILGWTTLLARELDRASPAGSLAADIESLAARAATLMRDARSLTHPQPTKPIALDLNGVILGMQPLIERLFATSMTLDFALDAAVGAVRVDRVRLEHVLLNLLVNARNALPGAGQVTIGTSVIHADAPGTPRFISITVSDTGSGMTEEVRSRAFDDFFTTTAASGGTGLGLASVRRFARESGGTVTLDSAPARGTTVTILLPRVGAEAAA